MEAQYFFMVFVMWQVKIQPSNSAADVAWEAAAARVELESIASKTFCRCNPHLIYNLNSNAPLNEKNQIIIFYIQTSTNIYLQTFCQKL